MFGYTRIKETELKALQQENMEIKGYYANEAESANQLFRMLASQLHGMDMGSIKGMSRDAIKDAYETIAPVRGIIDYIAKNVAEVSKFLELRDIKTGDYVEKHEVLDLLNNPNDRFTRSKLFRAWAVNRNIFDDCFVYAPKSLGKDRFPKEMYILSGQDVMVEKGGIAKPFKGIKLKNSPDGIELEDNVFESFGYNLDMTSFYGTSKIATAAVYLTVMERAMNRQATSLKNGGAASLITPAANSTLAPLKPDLDDMEQKINAQKNVNRNLMLKAAIDVHTLGDKPVDLSILESHKDAINVLCFLYEIPVDIYLGQSKYENAKEAKRTIYEQIAIPQCEEFAADLLHYLELDTQYELRVNTEHIEALKDKASDTMDTLAKMHASLNEMREANGYDRIEEEWADQPMIPMGQQFGNESFDISE